MGIKEILDKIQGLLPAESGADLKSAVTDALAEASLMADKLTARNKENQKRREENEALEAKVADLEAKNAKLEGANNSDELTAYKSKAEDYDKLIAEQNAALITKWKGIDDKLGTITDTDKRFETITAFKAKLSIPAEGQELTAEIARENIKLYEVLESTGIMNDQEKAPEYGKSKGGEPAPKTGADAVLNIIKRGNKQ